MSNGCIMDWGEQRGTTKSGKRSKRDFRLVETTRHNEERKRMKRGVEGHKITELTRYELGKSAMVNYYLVCFCFLRKDETSSE